MKTMKSFRLSDVTIERLDFIVTNSKYCNTTEAIEDLISIHYLKLCSEIKNGGLKMKKCDKDTLANLISGELHELNIICKKCIDIGDTKAAEFFQEEIKKLEQLDSVIWQELK